MNERTTCSLSLFTSLSSMSVDSEEQANVNRKAVASIRAACVYLSASRPVAPRLSATEKTNVRKRFRQAGKPAEFWWDLTRRGLGGKTEAGTWALHTEMRWLAAPWSGSFVHSAVSVWKICGWGAVKKSRYNACFLTQDDSRYIFDECKWMPGGAKGFNET